MIAPLYVQYLFRVTSLGIFLMQSLIIAIYKIEQSHLSKQSVGDCLQVVSARWVLGSDSVDLLHHWKDALLLSMEAGRQF